MAHPAAPPAAGIPPPAVRPAMAAQPPPAVRPAMAAQPVAAAPAVAGATHCPRPRQCQLKDACSLSS